MSWESSGSEAFVDSSVRQFNRNRKIGSIRDREGKEAALLLQATLCSRALRLFDLERTVLFLVASLTSECSGAAVLENSEIHPHQHVPSLRQWT